jgi:hypothetical protein
MDNKKHKPKIEYCRQFDVLVHLCSGTVHATIRWDNSSISCCCIVDNIINGIEVVGSYFTMINFGNIDVLYDWRYFFQDRPRTFYYYNSCKTSSGHHNFMKSYGDLDIIASAKTSVLPFSSLDINQCQESVATS